MSRILIFFVSIFTTTGWAAAAELKKPSLFELTSTWKNQNGNKVKLSSLSGSKTIISMAYTHCAHSCPLTISKMISILERVPVEKRRGVKLVLASFDRKRDTPEQLKKYMISRKLDDSTWTLLTADDDRSVRELAVVLGINYKPIGDSEFTHSNVIVLLDSGGVPIDSLESLNADTQHFLHSIP